MADAHFAGKTLDDVMRDAVHEIRSCGDRIQPRKGPADEITGVLLEISDPRARLSRTETRGKVFSALGELCWYLAGSKELSFISYFTIMINRLRMGRSMEGTAPASSIGRA